jgi:hypothetical protein
LFHRPDTRLFPFLTRISHELFDLKQNTAWNLSPLVGC